MNRDYTIGIYIRLSMADEDTGYGNKAESDSISNQRMLINRYLDKHPTLSNYPRFEFADDGYTGTNFHRPQFTEMMEKVRRGEINLICVKDFSRFSRDYIETGNYLECTFPFMGVRFISINDGYDSDDYKGTTGGLEVVMRSIIYAAYSKDLSVKTTTAKIQMMKQGKYVGGYAPYGYVLHPTIRNKLKLDPEAARVVRRIFDDALAGKNTSQIALGLNDDEVMTPGQYFRFYHPDKKKFSRMSEKISWTAAMVYKILTNYVYTGATVGHKRKSGGVGSRKSISQDKENWIVVEGMHEAIISKDEYEQAQAVIRGGVKKPERKQRSYPLKGLVCCGNCKRVMTRRKNKGQSAYFYQCSHSTLDRDTECHVGEKYGETWIESVVQNALEQYLMLAEKQAVQDREVSSLRKAAIKECAETIRSLQKQMEQLKATKLRIYEKYTAGSITKGEYLKQKALLDDKTTGAEKEIRQGHERMQELDSERQCSDDRLNEVCSEYQGSKELTFDFAHAFISAIYIHSQDNIEIVWKFKDFLFEEVSQCKGDDNN